MTINPGDTTDVTTAGLARATVTREAAQRASDSQADLPIPVNDHIALSLATNLVQQVGQAGENSRLNRILELKHAIQVQQYVVDPMAVSHALIKAHLLGE